MEVIRATTSTGSELRRRPGLSLPPELVEKAVTRLCIVAVISATSTVLFWAVHGYFQPEVAEVHSLPLVRLLMLSVVLLTAAFLVLHRTGWVSKQTILHLGTGFQVLTSLAIAMFETTVPFHSYEVVRGVSAVALWITLCSLLIPSTPVMNLIASLASAGAWPLAYYLNTWLYGHEWIGWNRIAVWVFPLILTAVWTNFLNRQMFKMRLDAQKAEELGSYKLESLIGEGGMGEVWKARHRMLARSAAVKVIRPEILARHSIRDAGMVRKRFEREAQATASLRSPHTVALYDFGVSRDEAFYYVMELLDGVDLQTLVEQYGPLPAGRVQNILIHVCESLEEAHRLGMIHRDVKPRNIFLCKLGLQFDFAKVLDFGLVKTIQSSEEDLTQMSMDGSATGTPAYMAPEIAMGAKEIDGRSDIYGLGCVAYFLLTGELVFNEPSPMAAALAHVQKPPVPPSQRTEMIIPPSMERVVMQCLEKDPNKRPQSAWDLARQLENLRDIPRFCRDSAEKWWTINRPTGEAVPAPGSRGILDSAKAQTVV
ncbi:MAG: serine/threonine-protein kinase [Bryobacteraceae bacterium]